MPSILFKVLIFFLIRRPQNFTKSSPYFCPTYVVPVKSKVEISQTFVAFSEFMNFTSSICTWKFKAQTWVEHVVYRNCFWHFAIFYRLCIRLQIYFIAKFKEMHSIDVVKFIYSEKATKFCEISTLLLTGTTYDKIKVDISQNFVAFSE